jgi:hypothetical protein
MSEKERNRERLIAKRARALAMMLLTRHGDLLIEEVKDDIGLDYLVRFPSEAKDGLREFGVVVCAIWAAATKDEADKVLRPSVQRVKRYGPFLRPVCLFFFTMENDGGWYTWIAEPLETEAGKPVLGLRDEPDCRPLDRRALKDILERVDVWHEALLATLVVNGPGGTRTQRKRAKQ